VSIALINAVANLAGLGLPPVIGWIKDATGNFNIALLVVAIALVIGGLLGIVLAPRRRMIDAVQDDGLARAGRGTP
jgi:cyanate permease